MIFAVLEKEKMNKHCKGCIHQVFKDNDKYKSWGFCTIPNVMQKCLNDMTNCDNEEKYFVKELKQAIRENAVPSCMFVQSCFEGECPYKECKR